MGMTFYCLPCQEKTEAEYAEYQKTHPGEGLGHRLVWIATKAVSEDEPCPDCRGYGFGSMSPH